MNFENRTPHRTAPQLILKNRAPHRTAPQALPKIAHRTAPQPKFTAPHRTAPQFAPHREHPWLLLLLALVFLLEFHGFNLF